LELTIPKVKELTIGIRFLDPTKDNNL